MVLQLKSIESRYGAIRAIHDVNMNVNENQVVSIIGANGTGKSTLLRTIAGLMLPHKGTIFYDGEDVTNIPSHGMVRKNVILVPEGREIFSELSSEENLLLGTYHVNKKLSKGSLAKKLEDVYRLFPILRERKNQIAGTLSGGEQQMLAIGRGLLSYPRLFLLDEPSLGLAPVLIKDIMEALKQLIREQQMTLLLVEQNSKVALDISDYCYVMREGTIALEFPSNEVKDVADLHKMYLGTIEERHSPT